MRPVNCYEKFSSLFGFFRHLLTLTPSEIAKNFLNLATLYPEDLKKVFTQNVLSSLNFQMLMDF